MGFWRCYYHVVWATKNRAAIIRPDVAALIHQIIYRKSGELDCKVLAAYVMPDHVHVAANIPPKLAVAEWVRHVKGASTHGVNDLFPNLPERFQWQSSYGVLTFGGKNMDVVVDYIQRQKEHHATNHLYRLLEQVDD